MAPNAKRNSPPQAQSCRCKTVKGKKKRNLVVCVDGTSNQFGEMNTNVVELCSRLVKDEDQLMYYNSGIGTFARPSLLSLNYLLQLLSNIIDLMIAWNFDKGVRDAYRWLADNYVEGDQIFLFGFSRGAYQVRAIAGMIDTVGLIHKGNQEQIAFAYELYTNDGDVKEEENVQTQTNWSTHILLANLVGFMWSFYVPLGLESTEYTWIDGHSPLYCSPNHTDTYNPGSSQGVLNLLFSWIWWFFVWIRFYYTMKSGVRQVRSKLSTKAKHFGTRQRVPMRNVAVVTSSTTSDRATARFKETFSRTDVKVHFLGAWDTVSSVGIFHASDLPKTSGELRHICYFRHALALDERRVKFLPQFAHGAIPKTPEPDQEGSRPHIKEVWFPGTHSDIGGGFVKNNRRHPAFVWMSYEATHAGLKMNSDNMEWNWKELGAVHESLTQIWEVLEILPFTRPSYSGAGFNPQPFSNQEFGNNWRRWGVWGTLKFLLCKGLSLVDSPNYTSLPHFGQGREMLPGQKVHISVAFCPRTYFPKAQVPHTFSLPWEFFLHTGRKDGTDHSWELSLVEMDIFDASLAKVIVENIASLQPNPMLWAHRLTAMAWGPQGCASLRGVRNVTRRLLQNILNIKGDDEEKLHVQVAIVNAIIAFSGGRDKHLDASLWSDSDGLLCKSEFSLAFLCDENATQAKVSLIGNAAKTSKIKHLSPQILDKLFKILRDTRKFEARKSACAILAGLGSHTDIQKEIIERINETDVYISPTSDEAWPVIPVVAEFARDSDDICSKIRDVGLVVHLLDGLRLTANDLDLDIMESFVSAITALAVHDDIRRQMIPKLDSSFYDCLIDLLKAGDRDFRHAAINAIDILATNDDTRKTISNSFVTSLVNLLEEKKNVSVSALRTLAKLAKHADLRQKIMTSNFINTFKKLFLIENIIVFRDLAEPLMEVLEQDDIRLKLVDSDLTASLMKLLKSENGFLRFYIPLIFMALLIQLKQNNAPHSKFPDFISSFTDLLKDSKWYVRLISVGVLSGFGRHEDTCLLVLDRILPFYESLLRDEEEKIITVVALNITMFADRQELARLKVLDSVLPIFNKLLRDELASVRYNALYAIALLAKSDTIRSKIFNSVLPFLKKLLADKDNKVRQAMVRVLLELARHADSRLNMLDNIQPLLPHIIKDSAFEIAVVQFIGELAKHEDTCLQAFEAILPSLDDSIFNDDNHEIRQAAAHVVTAFAEHEDTRSKMFSNTVQSSLNSMLKDRNDDVRQAAIKAMTELFRHNDTRAQAYDIFRLSTFFEELVKDEINNIRQAAIEALTELVQYDDTRVQAYHLLTPLFKDLLEDENSDVCQATIKVVTELAQYKRATQLGTVDALGTLGDDSDVQSELIDVVLPVLIGLLEDEDKTPQTQRLTVIAICALAKHHETQLKLMSFIRPLFLNPDDEWPWKIRCPIVLAVPLLKIYDDTLSSSLSFILPRLEALLEDESDDVRSATVLTLLTSRHANPKLRAV